MTDPEESLRKLLLRVAEDPNRPGFVDEERFEQYLLSIEGEVAGGLKLVGTTGRRRQTALAHREMHMTNNRETTSKTRPPSSWKAKLQRRRAFCERFVANHHPEMVNTHKIKGAHPLKPLNGPRTIHGSVESDWWLQTNKCMCELGFTYLATLFKRHGLLDHAWMIGRSDQEPWAIASEPFSHIKPETIEQLRRIAEYKSAFRVDGALSA